MFSKFKISLFQPSKIANFQKDSKLTTALYYLLLVLLATIPSIILIFSSSGLSYEDKIIIRDQLRGVDIPYEIVDYELVRKVNDKEKSFKIELSETMTLIFTDLPSSEVKNNPIQIGSVILFTKDEVIYHSQFFEVIHIKYKDYKELENLDFIGATTNDAKFWDVVFPITNNLLKENSPRTRLKYSAFIFFASALFLLLFSLLIAFFQRVRLASLFTFGKIWQLSIYSMTPYIVVTLIGDLYGLGFLSFVGFIISYIYANIMSMSVLKK